MVINLSVKIGEIGLFTFIRRSGIRKRLQYRTSDFARFIYDDLSTSCKHLVNFGQVNLEFNSVKGVHPSSISSLDTFALLLDLAGISTEFSGAITAKFCFTYTLEGVFAMPRGLHASLCHAFLVLILL